MKALQLLNLGSKKLKLNKINTHKLDSEILLSEVLQKKKEFVIVNSEKKISKDTEKKFCKLINRRSLQEPIAYILKKKEFWSKSFYVDNNTLIPRPETELMVEELVKIYKNRNISILDIGTGSGCILISLLSELKNSYGIGIDISTEAIKIAKKNARLHNIENVKFLARSFTNFYNHKADLIVSNPPYIKKKDINNLDVCIKNFEPKLALDGGKDGLDLIRKVIYKSNEILKINGILALEIGNGQINKVSKILYKKNFLIKHSVKDFRNNTRCIISSLIK
tara:strand:+ start:3485 stop:4324 length:840 start_codon:yes stop_codon:yes gene_type:complete